MQTEGRPVRLPLTGLEQRPAKGHSVPERPVAVAAHVGLNYRPYASTEPLFERNVAVFEHSNGLVVVDAGGCPAVGAQVVRWINFFIYTHDHGDHNPGDRREYGQRLLGAAGAFPGASQHRRGCDHLGAI